MMMKMISLITPKITAYRPFVHEDRNKLCLCVFVSFELGTYVVITEGPHL